MDIEQLRELMELMIEKDVAELQVEQHGVQVRIRRPEPAIAAGVPVVAAAPAAGVAAPVAGVDEDSDAAVRFADAHIIRSPMVGTFYSAPEPDADPFAQVGDRVEEGQTLCIVEAMKLMNEITADTGGELVAVFVENAQPVEYGQELFAVRAG